eukprot:scaffold68642_cov58-Phaeocystis_antarctica.AAC.1
MLGPPNVTHLPNQLTHRQARASSRRTRCHPTCRAARPPAGRSKGPWSRCSLTTHYSLVTTCHLPHTLLTPSHLLAYFHGANAREERLTNLLTCKLAIY